MVSVKCPPYCIAFLSWGKSNLVVPLQREFVRISVCCVCRPRECPTERLVFQVLLSSIVMCFLIFVVELWVLDTGKIKQKLLQRAVLYICVRAQAELKRSFL